MKSTYVGTYRLGLRMIRLYVDRVLAGGSVIILPEDKGVPIVTVGIKYEYEDALGTLLHEVYELMLIDVRTRWAPEPMGSEESSDYLFIMPHNDLGRVHEQVARFLAKAIPDFSNTYNRLRKKKK